MIVKEAVVAITGGGQGLGRAMALDLATRGASLALIDLNEEKLVETRELCQRAGAKAAIYPCNVARETEVEATFARLASDYGRLDGLVNNAGILRDGLLLKARDGIVERKMSLAEWQAVIDVNLTGVFLCGREAAAAMIGCGSRGCIINITSIARAGNIGQSNYAAAKAGVASLTVTWARELARFGIRCMGIAPGVIETEMTSNMKPEALEMMTRMIPLRRVGQPSEIAHTVNYILENDYLSGRIIEIDGALRL